MAIDFPNSPTLGQAFGQYIWDGEKWLMTYVNAAPATALPLADGTAAVGASAKYAREDHVHPTDTGIAAANANANTRVAKAGDTMTGDLIHTRGGANNGYSFYGTSGGVYNGYDGTQYVINGANVLVYNSFTVGVNLTVNSNFYAGGAVDAGTVIRCVGGQACHSGIISSVGWGFWNSGQLAFGRQDASGTPDAFWMGLSTIDFRVSFAASYKPGGGAWVDSSDARIKNVVGDYDSGLAAINALRPVRYTYKGNDTDGVPTHERQCIAPTEATLAMAKAGPPAVPYPNSFHYQVAVDSDEFIGLIAQEAEQSMPELIKYRDGYIDGVAVTDLRDVDTGPLIFALINAVKELTARVAALEGTR